MDSSQAKARFLTPRILFVGSSFISLVICVLTGVAHYRKAGWGDSWHPIGWLLSMAFLMFAFLPPQRDLTAGFKSLTKPKTAFFLFWLLFFATSHLWNFRTAPWNGDGIFDDAARDLLYLKTHVTSRPFQAAWFTSDNWAYETLFHYYLWPWLHVFGYNILTNEAASLALWCTTFLFMLLLTDLFFGSYLITSVIALVFTFLPFAFIYSFFAFHYEMAAPLCVASLYFLHVGFKTDSSFCLALGGIAAGLCLASSLLGQQYVLALLLFVVLCAVFDRKRLKQGLNWRRVLTVIYGFAAAAMPILTYIVFNRHEYAFHQWAYWDRFWQAVRGHPSPDDITYYLRHLWSSFFTIPGPRLFFADALPIPLPYYWLLVPGFVLALWQKRFEIGLLVILPAVGVLMSGGPFVEHRMLPAIPFWSILMAFTFAGLLTIKLSPALKILLLGVSAAILLSGLVPSAQYIYGKTTNPSSIGSFAQGRVAVSRFLKNVVAGKEHPNPPRLEHDEFNRVEGIPDPPYEALICAREANVVVHLFLHDYDDARILSFCGGTPVIIMTEQDVWSHNKRAIVDYVPKGKDLKLIWESDPKIETIINLLRSLGDLGTAESISFSVAGGVITFDVLNIGNKNIHQFQERVRELPDSLP